MKTYKYRNYDHGNVTLQLDEDHESIWVNSEDDPIGIEYPICERNDSQDIARSMIEALMSFYGIAPGDFIKRYYTEV